MLDITTVDALRTELRRLAKELVHCHAELSAMRDAGWLLEREVERVAAERDRALISLSRRDWRGSLAMPDDWHLERGKKLVGLASGESPG